MNEVLSTKKDTIHIALASDNNYVILLAALISSIIDNHHSDENIVFYILNDNISKSKKDKINSLIKNFPSVKIDWKNTSEFIGDGVIFPFDSTTFPYTASLRLFAPHILDPGVKKLIYFDVDMIVEGDVSELWKTDLKGYTVGAVIDLSKTVDSDWGGIPNHKDLGIPSGTKYFNSGLLVMDVDKWKSEKIQKQVFDVMNSNTKYLNYPDQYGLNVTFVNKWLELDPLWNWYSHEYNSEAKCIHFTRIKPIFKSCISDKAFIKLFFKYLDQTPWKGMKLKSNYQRLINKGIIKTKKYLSKYRF